MKKEISMWYSKETYLKTYRAKLLPTRGKIFWKILPGHAIDPPDFVKNGLQTKDQKNKRKNIAIKRAG